MVSGRGGFGQDGWYVRFFLAFLILSLLGLSVGFGAEDPWKDPLLAEGSGALLIDPLFTPTHLTTTFHMTPLIFYGGDVLRPGDFDFDFVIGTFGTDFDESEKRIRLVEDSDYSIYTDIGWRMGLVENLGRVHLPIEIYTQLPIFFPRGSLSSFSIDNAGVSTPVRSLDEDFAVGKWIWGLRIGLMEEAAWRPSVVLGGSVGLPVDDSLASDDTDFDLRLTIEKHLGRSVVGTVYGGVLFPGDGKPVLKDVAVDTDSSVPYVGVLAETNLAQLCGNPEPGRVWFQVGGTWRDSLYDFGALGPDYAEEEMKALAGVTVDLGWWGSRIGRPQGMLGVLHTVHGGPEDGETELVAQLHIPYHLRAWGTD